MKSIYKLLFEVDEEEASEYIVGATNITTKKLATDSVDDQIDQFLIGYEETAIKKEKADGLFESLKKNSLQYLLEQPEDEEFEEDEEGEEEEGEEEEEIGGSEDIEVTDSAPMPIPKIDMDNFAHSVMRLATSYENLLDVRTVVINRAKNYLKENYSEDYVKKFEEIMNSDGRFDLKKYDRQELEDDVFAVGAFAGGTGALGGGGG